MQNKKIIPIKIIGTLFRNFDFSICDLIMHPNISNNKEIISTAHNIANTIVKAINKTSVTIFSKLFI